MVKQSALESWLMELYERHGRLTPEIVREEARPVDSPAHAYVFALSEADAAEEAYLERAHKLITRVRYTITKKDGTPARSVRFFYAVPDDESAYVYEPIAALVRSPDTFAAARNEAIRRLADAETAVEDFDVIAAGTPTAPKAKRARVAIREAVGALSDSP